jgi:C1A family cysteine protease
MSDEENIVVERKPKRKHKHKPEPQLTYTDVVLPPQNDLPDHLKGRVFPVKPSPYNPEAKTFEKNCARLPPSKTVANGDLYDTTTVKLPTKLDLRPLMTIPRDQGVRGTCVAFSCCALKEYQERIDQNYRGYFSPDTVFFYRKDKSGPITAGMYPTESMEILMSKGIAREDIFPYNPRAEPNMIPPHVQEQAKENKIKSFVKIDTIMGLKEALFMHGPAIAAFPVYDGNPQFWMATAKNIPCQGGHCVTIVGYTTKGFIIRNSWGPHWNGDGCLLYPYDQWGSHWEILSAVDEDNVHWYPDPPCGSILPATIKRCLPTCMKTVTCVD